MPPIGQMANSRLKPWVISNLEYIMKECHVSIYRIFCLIVLVLCIVCTVYCYSSSNSPMVQRLNTLIPQRDCIEISAPLFKSSELWETYVISQFYFL